MQSSRPGICTIGIKVKVPVEAFRQCSAFPVRRIQKRLSSRSKLISTSKLEYEPQSSSPKGVETKTPRLVEDKADFKCNVALSLLSAAATFVMCMDYVIPPPAMARMTYKEMREAKLAALREKMATPGTTGVESEPAAISPVQPVAPEIVAIPEPVMVEQEPAGIPEPLTVEEEATVIPETVAAVEQELVPEPVVLPAAEQEAVEEESNFDELVEIKEGTPNQIEAEEETVPAEEVLNVEQVEAEDNEASPEVVSEEVDSVSAEAVAAEGGEYTPTEVAVEQEDTDAPAEKVESGPEVLVEGADEVAVQAETSATLAAEEGGTDSEVVVSQNQGIAPDAEVSQKQEAAPAQMLVEVEEPARSEVLAGEKEAASSVDVVVEVQNKNETIFAEEAVEGDMEEAVANWERVLADAYRLTLPSDLAALGTESDESLDVTIAANKKMACKLCKS